MKYLRTVFLRTHREASRKNVASVLKRKTLSTNMAIDNGKIAVAVAAGAVVTAVVVRQMSSGKHEEAPETWESHVKEHGSLQEIATNLHVLEASGCERGPPTRNMVIYRVPDGSNRLVIFNGIAVNDSTRLEIEKMGTPSVLVVPNWFHKCCAAVWKQRYPDIMVVCPEVAKETVEKTVPVSASTRAWSQMKEWSTWVNIRTVDGWACFEDLIEVALEASGEGKKAVLTADLLFTIPICKEDGMIGKFITWIFDSSIELPSSENDIVIPKVSRIGRWIGIKDWKLAEQWYRNYAEKEGKKVAAILVGHGVPVKELNSGEGCTKALLGVADQLVKPRW
jgi:hypothetical protein